LATQRNSVRDSHYFNSLPALEPARFSRPKSRFAGIFSWIKEISAATAEIGVPDTLKPRLGAASKPTVTSSNHGLLARAVPRRCLLKSFHLDNRMEIT
jgi:hypothetical protein